MFEGTVRSLDLLPGTRLECGGRLVCGRAGGGGGGGVGGGGGCVLGGGEIHQGGCDCALWAVVTLHADGPET